MSNAFTAFGSALADGKVNLSIASLPLTLFIAVAPHWYSIFLIEKHKVNGGWGNENPRAFVARLNNKATQGKRLSDIEEKVLRGQSAQMNGFEWWPIWAAAVLFGYLAKIPNEQMNRYTAIYVGARIAFNFLYVSTRRRSRSYLRTFAFFVSQLPSTLIFLNAAVALY